MLSFKDRLAARAAAMFIRFVRFTGRWTQEGYLEHIGRALEDNRKVILAFWHGRLLMLPQTWILPRPMHMLISKHRDGRLIAEVMTYFNIKAIPGSTGRGGSEAARAIIRLLNSGAVVGITPDGPRGPAETVSDGIVALARLADAVIFPLAYDCRRKIHLKTWDRFLLPAPFTTGFAYAGPGIDARLYKDDPEGLRDAIAAGLANSMRIAGERTGHHTEYESGSALRGSG